MEAVAGQGYDDMVRAAMVSFVQSDVEDALAKGEEALRSAPERSESYCVLGIISFFYGQDARAIELLEKAHQIEPDAREYADLLAHFYTRVGKLSDGLYYAKLSTALTPQPVIGELVPADLTNYFDALSSAAPSSGVVDAMRALNMHDYEQAVRACEKEMRLGNRDADCLRLFGRALNLTGRPSRGAAALHAAIHAAPDDAAAFVELGRSLTGLGRYTEARTCLLRAIDLGGDDAAIRAGAGAGLASLPDIDAKTLRRVYGDLACRARRTKKLRRAGASDSDAQARIRIGYLSNRFMNGDSARLIEPLIANHDRQRFEVFCYHFSPIDDSVTTRMQNETAFWRKVHDVDPDTIATIIQRDNLDVLVDLTEHAADPLQHVLARRPSQVQASWLGFPDAAGAFGITSVLSNGVLADADKAVAIKGQKIVEMDGPLFALDPDVMADPPSALPAKTAGHVTFGGVCDPARLGPDGALLWARAVQSIHQAHLYLGLRSRLTRPVKEQMLDLFAHFGISDRITFQELPDDEQPKKPWSDIKNTFFSTVDVMLDTAPITGGIEVADALWAGVPVVTLRGERRPCRIGAAVLTAARRPEWVADDGDGFVAAARTLGTDTDALAGLRQGLRDSLQSAPLFDPVSFARNVEGAFMSMLSE